MNEELKNRLKGISVNILETMPKEICALLVEKGLTFAQAEALLDYAKDLLRSAKI